MVLQYVIIPQQPGYVSCKFRRIREGYEADPPIYTADEVNEKLEGSRDNISHAEIEIHRLHDLIDQPAISRQTSDPTLKILESIRDTNLETASPVEMRNLIAQMGIKMYPSEDGKVVRIASTLQFAPSPLDLSPYKISIASPVLIIPRYFKQCKTYLELTLECSEVKFESRHCHFFMFVRLD